jgi:hypothetical protein
MTTPPPAFVITCRVPSGSSDELRVDVAGRTATAATPRGFRHTFELPPDVAIEKLEWQVYADVLELRVPYRAMEP